jgi:uncharacterized protein YrrD
MDLDLGKHVKTSDGHDLGKVDRLIINPETYAVEGFVVHEGFLLTRDVIVDLEDVDSIDDEGVVHLKVSEADAKNLDAFVAEKYYVPSSEQYHSFSSQSWIGGAVSDPIDYGPTHYGSEAHLIHPSSVSSDDVILSEGTEVYDSEGKHIGSIDEIIYTPNGLVTGLIIRAGFLFHYDVQVPIDLVSTMTHERIHLRVNAASLEASHPSDVNLTDS